MKLKVLIVSLLIMNTLIIAQRLTSSIQFDYNYLSTSALSNNAYWVANQYVAYTSYYDSSINGYGISYTHHYNIWDELYLGFKVGYFFSQSHFNRFVVGSNLKYYFYKDWFLLSEYNYGVGTWSNGSNHNPSRGVSQFYYSVGLGVHVINYLAISIKYNKPFNNVYGTYESNTAGISNGKYYLKDMYTVAFDCYF